MDKSAAELEFELRFANFKLEIIQEIAASLVQSNNPLDAISTIMDRIFTLVEMEGASVLVLDEKGSSLKFLVVRGEKEKELTGVVMDAGKGIAGKVIETGQPVLVQNTDEDKAFYREIDETIGYNTQSLIAVPLKTSERVLGVLEGVNIDDEEVKSPVGLTDVFETIASLITVSLENGRLLEKLNHELEINRKLLEISRAINSGLDMPETFDVVVGSLMKALASEAASMLLLDESGTNLEFFAADGDKKDYLKKVTIPIESGIAGYVARTGTPVISNDVSQDENFDGSIDRETGFHTRSVLCAPMIAGDKMIGVLEVMNKLNEVPFSEEDLHLLETIANESAYAIRNRRGL